MVRVALVGLGKMGLSHLAIIRRHPEVEVVGVCDASGFMLDVLAKQTNLRVFTKFETMLDAARPDAVIIATPSHLHASMVRAALERHLHVFCEKPLFLDVGDGEELSALARQQDVVTQVGYHNRFVGTFAEARRLLDQGVLGEVTNALAEAYGPVVTKPAGLSWRSQKTMGGGCLYDYAAHPVDLLTWYLGPVSAARGSGMRPIFSREVDDSVVSTLEFSGGAVGQLCVNWSDSSQRKMTTSVSLWGTRGRLRVDRQEIQVHLNGSDADLPVGYGPGWNVKYTTDLTPAPWFYVRGEEYSHQLDAFIRRIRTREASEAADFEAASATDRALAMIATDAQHEDARDPARLTNRRTRPAVAKNSARPQGRTARAFRVLAGRTRAAAHRWHPKLAAAVARTRSAPGR